MMRKHQPLGSIQKLTLHSLIQHKSWPGGWVMGTPSRTKRVLESLRRRGYVVKRIENCRDTYRASRIGVCALVSSGNVIMDRGSAISPADPNWKSFIIQFPFDWEDTGASQ